MSPYRSPDSPERVDDRAWPLPALFVAAAIAWWLVEHAIASIGRF